MSESNETTIRFFGRSLARGRLTERVGKGAPFDTLTPADNEARALDVLAYLVLRHRDGPSRGQVIKDVFPQPKKNAKEEEALYRKARTVVGALFPDAFKTSKPGSAIPFVPDGIAIDVLAFHGELDAAAKASDANERAERLLRAVELYWERVAPGLPCDGHEWLANERRLLRQACVQAYRQLADEYRMGGDADKLERIRTLAATRFRDLPAEDLVAEIQAALAAVRRPAPAQIATLAGAYPVPVSLDFGSGHGRHATLGRLAEEDALADRLPEEPADGLRDPGPATDDGKPGSQQEAESTATGRADSVTEAGAASSKTSKWPDPIVVDWPVVRPKVVLPADGAGPRASAAVGAPLTVRNLAQALGRDTRLLQDAIWDTYGIAVRHRRKMTGSVARSVARLFQVDLTVTEMPRLKPTSLSSRQAFDVVLGHVRRMDHKGIYVDAGHPSGDLLIRSSELSDLSYCGWKPHVGGLMKVLVYDAGQAGVGPRAAAMLDARNAHPLYGIIGRSDGRVCRLSVPSLEATATFTYTGRSLCHILPLFPGVAVPLKICGYVPAKAAFQAVLTDAVVFPNGGRQLVAAVSKIEGDCVHVVSSHRGEGIIDMEQLTGLAGGLGRPLAVGDVVANLELVAEAGSTEKGTSTGLFRMAGTERSPWVDAMVSRNQGQTLPAYVYAKVPEGYMVDIGFPAVLPEPGRYSWDDSPPVDLLGKFIAVYVRHVDRIRGRMTVSLLDLKPRKNDPPLAAGAE